MNIYYFNPGLSLVLSKDIRPYTFVLIYDRQLVPALCIFENKKIYLISLKPKGYLYSFPSLAFIVAIITRTSAKKCPRATQQYSYYGDKKDNDDQENGDLKIQ